MKGLLRRGGSGIVTAVRGNLTMLAIPGFLATMGLEYLALHRGRKRLAAIGEPTIEPNTERPLGYEPRDTAASMSMGLGMLAIGVVADKGFGPIDRWIFGRRLGQLGTRRFGFLGAVIAWDFFYYLSHRMSHEHRVMWAAHVNHHSSERYNLSTALRQSWTNSISHWVYFPMFVAGFSPSQVSRAGEINLLYQYWVHTEGVDKLPAAAEAVLNTASHHRVHHGTNPQYLDRNYAGILIVWDRMFRTFEPEGERVRYGLTKNIATHNPIKIAFHEWSAMLGDVRSAPGWRARLDVLVGPPR